jgi:flagellar hook-basal body complex protein FliE
MNLSSLPPGLRILPAEIPLAQKTPATGKTTGNFGEVLREAVGEVDSLQQDADYKVTGMLEGKGVDVHDAMIAVEKADLSFQLMMQVRNKVVQAYQQVASMQF